jgi:signal transduction histidine kinase
MYIIVADDQHADRDLLKIVLENAGYRVKAFVNGRDALENARQEPPDMFISDILMPIMDGFALLYEVRRDTVLHNTPFIFYTATYTDEDDQNFASRLAIDAYLLKPQAADVLLKVVDSVFSTARERAGDVDILAEQQYYTNYSQRLVAKLEKKLLQLQEANALIARQRDENQRLLNEAKAALSTRDAFISVAAHELRTPLTTLMGWLQLSERDLSRSAHGASALNTAKVQENMAKAIAQARRMERLIHDMTDTTAAVEGQLILTLQPISLRSIIEEVVANARVLVSRHDIMVDLPDNPLMVNGDSLKLSRVFGNLLDNALKFTPDGGEVRIFGIREDEVVIISVSNNGPSIEQVHRTHIFEPYYQHERNIRSRHFGGLGLGLFITKSIVEAHKGTVTLEDSDALQGTTFTVRLPLSENPSTTAE